MAWISGLADKAEVILNKIDQNAATALNLPNSGSFQLSPIKVVRNITSGSKSQAHLTLSQYELNRSKDTAHNIRNDVELPGAISKSLNAQEIIGEKCIVIKDSALHHSSPITDSIAIEMVEEQKSFPLKLNENSFITNTNRNELIKLEDKEILALRNALKESTSERDELRLKLNELCQTIENVSSKQGIEQFELLVHNLTEERNQVQQNLLESEKNNAISINIISELEAKNAKLQKDYLDMVQKLTIQMKETDKQRQDLKDYRLKAQLALQLKDNIITELKSNQDSSNTTSNTHTHLLNSELKALKELHQSLLEEHQSLLIKLEKQERECSLMTVGHTEKLNNINSTVEILLSELQTEREFKKDVESSKRLLQEELQDLQQRFSNHMAASATKLQEKEKHIERLCKEILSLKPIQEDSLAYYTTRIDTLTQALVDKQKSIEAITIERNALRIQLEKMHDQLNLNKNNRATNFPHNTLLSNSTDDTKAQYPQLLRANPFDNRVSRRMKRAYSSLDSIGIRVGSFLRRYPLMRIFVLMYVAMLHMWVIFVLLSSTPN